VFGEIAAIDRKPLLVPATYVAAESSASQADTGAVPETAAKMTILVVDDNPPVAMNTADMLEKLGHNTHKPAWLRRCTMRR
jgi:PleD family two-component response regulator